MHLGVCSPIAEYDGNDSTIRRLMDEQLSFVGDSLTSSDNRFVFYIHNPRSINHFQKVVEPHVNRLENIVYGDVHSPFGDFLYKAGSFLGDKFYRNVSFKGVFCPSVIPAWGKGQKLLVLELENGKPSFSKVDLSNTGENINLPTNSILRSAIWYVFPS